MKTEKTEKHEIIREDGILTVEISYTPRTHYPLRIYRLKMSVKAWEKCSPYVFVYHRATTGAPMEDGSSRDEFVCIADELDEDEIPTEEHGPDIERGIPYYRAKSLELIFRNSDLMYETARSLIDSLRSSRPRLTP